MEIIQSKNSNNNSNYELFDTLSGNYVLETFQVTNNFYNIYSWNKKIYIFVNGNNYEVDMIEGHFTFSQLPSMIQTVLNDATGESFIVNGNSNTRKLTFTNSNGFYFTFGTNTSNSGKNIIGISGNTTSNITYTSDICCDLNTIKSFFCEIREDNSKIFNTNTLTASFIITINEPFGNIIQYPKYSGDSKVLLHFNDVRKLNIKFYTIDNKPLYINDEWFIILKKL